MIACVLIPSFAVTVERRENPALQTTPVIVYAAEKVLARSDEAAQMGIESAMPIRKARALCPDGSFVLASPARYRQTASQVADILRQFTPLVEPGAEEPGSKQPGSKQPPARQGSPSKPRRKKAGEGLPFPSDDRQSAVWYLDLERLQASDMQVIVQQIIRAVQHVTALSPAIGIASGKFPARLAAASASPGTDRIISAGEEAVFLGPLPITLLPLDKEIARRLRLLGIQTLAQFARLPAGAASTQFGRTGYLLRQFASGRDTRPVIPEKRQTTEQAAYLLETPVYDRLVLENVLHGLADDLAERLQQTARMVRCITLRVRLDDGMLLEDQFLTRQPMSSAGHLAQILDQLLARLRLRGGVTNLEVILSDLVPAVGQQLDLFVHQTGQDKRLRQALRQAIARYGAECFAWISPATPESRLPERRYHVKPVERT